MVDYICVEILTQNKGRGIATGPNISRKSRGTRTSPYSISPSSTNKTIAIRPDEGLDRAEALASSRKKESNKEGIKKKKEE